jgi:hypothetical protein
MPTTKQAIVNDVMIGLTVGWANVDRLMRGAVHAEPAADPKSDALGQHQTI